MNFSDELTEKVETEYPLPIALTYYKVRNNRFSKPESQFRDSLELFEVIFKFLTSISIRAYLIDGGKESKINDLLKNFSRTPDGSWIELLRGCLSIYRIKDKNKKLVTDIEDDVDSGPINLIHKLVMFYFEKLEKGKNNVVYKSAETVVDILELSKQIINQPRTVFLI